MSTEPQSPAHWNVYIVRCADGTLYTGIARDLHARIAIHNSGKGARYTSARLPVKLIYAEAAENRGGAQKREYEIRKLGRDEKLTLARRFSRLAPDRAKDPLERSR